MASSQTLRRFTKLPIKYCKDCIYYPGDNRGCAIGNKASVDKTSYAPSKCYVEAKK